jgi:hypothetical protein
MHEKVDSFLVVVSHDVFSSLSQLLAFVVPCQVSWVVVKRLFHSDSFLLLEKGVCLFLVDLFVPKC